MESWPNVQIPKEHVPHYLFHVAIVPSECLGGPGERFDEPLLVLSPEETKSERFLARFDDIVRTEDDDSRDQFSGDSRLE